MTDVTASWGAIPSLADTDTAPNPPRPRATPPLLMGDILMSRRGVPVFVEDWLRLERERDARRARAQNALKETGRTP